MRAGVLVCQYGPRMAQKNPPKEDALFTNYEVAENAARELVLGAEDLAENARDLPASDPTRLAMTQAAAAALAAASPFIDSNDKRRFVTGRDATPRQHERARLTS